MRKKILYGFIFVVIIGISATLYIQSRPGASPTNSTVYNEPYIEFDVTRETINNTIEVKGKSTYAEETRIYAPFTGSVKEWVAKDGSQVKQGDTLFRMDQDNIRKELAVKEADFQKLTLELELEETKMNVFGDTSVIATSAEQGKEEAFERFANTKLAEIQTKISSIHLDTMKNEISELKKHLTESSYPAPESGIFLFEEEKEPLRLSEQMLVGKIVDLTQLEMHTTVGEYEVFQLEEGLTVDIQLDALPHESLTGTITHVSKFAQNTESGSTSQFPVTIALDSHDRLIAGLSLTGNIVTAHKDDVIAVPTIAVQKDGDDYFVYKWDGVNSEKQIIEIGLETSEFTEVIKGLNEGDQVILK